MERSRSIINRRIVCSLIVLTAGLLLLPGSSRAQSIGGQVTDATGSVLPGVTVEARSPALIERVRQAVTDGQGRYLLTELSPGVYQVTFALPGFATVVREGIELTAGFTAPVNIQMTVGAVAESVTVSGASPVVDVQSIRTQVVTTRTVLDAVPTGRNVEAFGRLIPGTGRVTGGGSAYSPDVGGSSGMQQQPLSFRGNTNTVQMVDGFRTSIATSTAFSGDYFNNGSMQEIQYTTSGESAEGTGGGMKVNIIPKDGGNSFAGSIYGDYTYDAWSWRNLDARIRDRGLENAADILKIWDFNPSFGGPIARNRVWFQATYRNWGVDKTVPGSFSEITGEPGHDFGHINSTILRVTWQMSAKNKLSVMYSRPPKYRNGWGLNANVSAEASAIRTDPMIYQGTAKWVATLTNRLVVQAGVGLYDQQYTEWYQPEQVTAPGQARRTFPVTGSLYDPYFANEDLTTGLVRGSYSGGHSRNYNQVFNYIASLAYVTGSHSFRIGLDLADIQARQSDQLRGDLRIRWRNGQPDSVVLLATPRYTTEDLLDTGVYLQDVWTYKRFTLNGGLRFESYDGGVPAQWNPAGSWIDARLTEPVEDIPKWTDVSPRGGVSWDVFGNGKTAIKFSIGRYAAVPMVGMTRNNNPMRQIVYETTARWLGDLNGNLVPDPNELGPFGNQFFGTVRPNTTYDTDVIEGFGARPYNWDYAVTVQRELRAGLAINSSVYYRRYYNQTVTDNLAIGPADFDEFTVVSPQDPRLPGGGGQTMGALYVIKDAKRPLSDSYTTFAENFGNHKETYRGADVTVSWRAGNGRMLSGGMDWGQAYLDTCYVIDNPQLLDCRRRVDPAGGAVRGGLSIKLLGVLPVPAGWQLSGTIQSGRGPEILANWNTRDANRTLTFVDSTRTSLGATPSVTIPLIRPGTQYDDQYVQLDVRGSRSFSLGASTQLKLNLDLYNALNGNAVIRRNNTWGPNWGRPINVLEGRLFKLGAQLDF